MSDEYKTISSPEDLKKVKKGDKVRVAYKRNSESLEKEGIFYDAQKSSFRILRETPLTKSNGGGYMAISFSLNEKGISYGGLIRIETRELRSTGLLKLLEARA